MQVVQGRGAATLRSPQPSLTDLVRPVGSLFATVAALFATWQRRATTRRQLGRLDARLAADVGLDFYDVRLEATRPFWQGYGIALLDQRERALQALAAARNPA